MSGGDNNKDSMLSTRFPGLPGTTLHTSHRLATPALGDDITTLVFFFFPKQNNKEAWKAG